LAALYGHGGNIVIGFEAFPRRLQAVLDDWVEGKLTDEAFVKASEWRQVWGYDAALYMPLFQFARLNRIPMVALNVEQKLVSRVGQQGWENVPASEREGLSDPAPASPDYQRELARVYLIKKALPPGADPISVSQGSSPAEPAEAAVEEAVKEPEFKRFVQAQQTWDRAMAEALAGAKRKFSNATVVGILGSGHVEGGYGVSHQLKDLGIAEVTSLIPVPTDAACMLVGTPFADAVFTLPHEDEAPPAERPRLGVALVDGNDAPRINRVVDKSVAEIAGLKVGDQVVRAAGLAIRNPDELVEVIARQAPGTWLPLSVRRDGLEIELIAKFPTRSRRDR
jgi:membrane-associated protease RseP (regulator of RpoE activity)